MHRLETQVASEQGKAETDKNSRIASLEASLAEAESDARQVSLSEEALKAKLKDAQETEAAQLARIEEVQSRVRMLEEANDQRTAKEVSLNAQVEELQESLAKAEAANQQLQAEVRSQNAAEQERVDFEATRLQVEAESRLLAEKEQQLAAETEVLREAELSRLRESEAEISTPAAATWEAEEILTDGQADWSLNLSRKCRSGRGVVCRRRFLRY